MRPRSLSARIVAGVVGVDLLLTALLLAFGIFIARTELLSAFEVSLRSKALSVRALVRYSEDNTSRLIFDSSGVPLSSDSSHPDLFAVYDSSGKLLAQSPGWVGFPQRTRYLGNGFAKFVKEDVPYRAIVVRDVSILDREDEVAGPPAKVSVIYASSALEVRSRVFHIGLYLGLAGIVLLFTLAGLTVWIIGRSLSPLHDLAARAGQITVRNWTFEPPPAAKVTAELAPLTSALETLLSRLRDSFAQQRRFTSDLAHELKTSVAIIKSSVQVSLQNPKSTDEYRAEIELLLGDTERLETLVERMLRLARAEQWSEDERQKKRSVSDLLSTCESAISRVATIAATKDIRIQCRGDSATRVLADPEDLELIWVNLLDNAIRHSPETSTVAVQIQNGPIGFAIVAIKDAGEGIAASELPRVFERFHRGGAARGRSTGGFGLGLAICKAIVEAYGGSIEIQSTQGEGTTVRVQIPRNNPSGT